MVSGIDIRLNRIMRDGKMLCIPMDHGISNGPIQGLESPQDIITSCQKNGLTCVILNKGILSVQSKPLEIGTLLHLSASTSLSGFPNKKILVGTAAEASSLGADGVSLHINIGGDEEPEMLQQLGFMAKDCHSIGMPLLAMMYPRGKNITNPHDPDVVAHVARIGAECGADIIKTLYTGDIDSFSKIIKSTPVPIVVAGESKTETDLQLLQMTYAVMQTGAVGVTFGRNIFGHKHPQKITMALADIIFENKTPNEALKRIE